MSLSLPHEFTDEGLLELALTHASTGGEDDNERLEFLGDAVLDLIVAEELFGTRTNHDTIIEQDLLQETARDNDPRLQLTQRKIIVIQQRIAEERQKIGLGDNGTGEAAAALVGQYEGLIVDREFAEQAYVKALSNYDAAIAEANRKSRYLAEYIRPTISQEAQYPQRYIITTLLGLFLFLFWFILLLVYYSIKDRR